MTDGLREIIRRTVIGPRAISAPAPVQKRGQFAD